MAGDFVYQNLDCGHTYEDTHKEPMPDHLARVAFMTPDELQALDFGAIDQERARLRLKLDLKYSRRAESDFRRLGAYDASYYDTAARQNTRTRELERLVGEEP